MKSCIKCINQIDRQPYRYGWCSKKQFAVCYPNYDALECPNYQEAFSHKEEDPPHYGANPT